MNIGNIDFSQLEPREIGSWPQPIRIALIALSGVIGVLVIYFLFLSSQVSELETVRAQQQAKRDEFKQKYGLAANLDAYKQQMVQIQDAYKVMLKQLPDSSHVPELIDSISRIAANDNLKFDSIKLGDPKSVLGFYKELPIDISVTGAYHSFGKFVSDISKLSRIVTLHDFSIKSEGQGGSLLSMKISAKTYWLSEDTEPKAATPASSKKSKNTKGKAPAKGAAPAATPGQTGPVPPQAPNIPNRPGATPGAKAPGGIAGPSAEGVE